MIETVCKFLQFCFLSLSPLLLSIAVLIVFSHQCTCRICVFFFCYFSLALTTRTHQDWGLFQYPSPHFPLRAALLFPAWFYYAAIATDFVLRLSWIITISPHAFGFAIARSHSHTDASLICQQDVFGSDFSLRLTTESPRLSSFPCHTSRVLLRSLR
jgi:hypothetical protein